MLMDNIKHDNDIARLLVLSYHRNEHQHIYYYSIIGMRCLQYLLL